MDERQRIIAGACLKHYDSGEASFDKEARRILQALSDNGYEVVKNVSSEHQCKFYVNAGWTGYSRCECGKEYKG